MFESVRWVGGCLTAVMAAGAAAAPSWCPSGAWSSHTSVRETTTIAVDGEVLWIGSLFGGVLEWDTVTLSGRIHTRTAHCLPASEIFDVAVAASGEVWATGFYGVGRRPAAAPFERRWDLFLDRNSRLPDHAGAAVAVEDRGDVWIGAFESGAYRYDGEVWEHFHPFNSGLGNPSVTSVRTAGETVWFGTWGGAFRMIGDDFTRFTPANTGTPPGYCQAAMPVPADRLGLTSGVVVVRHADPETGVTWISSLDDGGCLNLSTSRFDGARWLTFSTANSDVASNLITGVASAPDGRDVLTSFGGSQFFDAGELTFTDIRFPSGAALTATDVARVGADLWFASPEHGLVRWRNGSLAVFRAPGLNHTVVQGIAVIDGAAPGTEPEVWVGTGAGAQRLRDGAWSTFDPSNSPLPGYDVRAVVQGADGAIWFGTGVRGISRFDGQTWTAFNSANSALNSDNISHLVVDPASGELWAAYRFGRGAARFDGANWTAFDVGPDSGTTDLAVDHQGNLWFAGPSGVVRFDGVDAQALNDGLPSVNAWALAIGPHNEIYAGTADGVAVMNPDGTWTELPKIDPHINNIRALGVDAGGNLWAGAWDVGLAEYDGAGWTVRTRDDGLTNVRVHTIRFAADAKVWIGTEGGISVFDPHFVLVGDLNHDGRVDRADLTLLLRAWGRPGPTDLDGDGTTSGTDLILLLDHWRRG